MPSLGEILAGAQPADAQLPVTMFVSEITDANSMGGISFVNMTGRTPAAGNIGLCIRAGGVFYLVGLRA